MVLTRQKEDAMSDNHIWSSKLREALINHNLTCEFGFSL